MTDDSPQRHRGHGGGRGRLSLLSLLQVKGER